MIDWRLIEDCFDIVAQDCFYVRLDFGDHLVDCHLHQQIRDRFEVIININICVGATVLPLKQPTCYLAELN